MLVSTAQFDGLIPVLYRGLWGSMRPPGSRESRECRRKLKAFNLPVDLSMVHFSHWQIINVENAEGELIGSRVSAKLLVKTILALPEVSRYLIKFKLKFSFQLEYLWDNGTIPEISLRLAGDGRGTAKDLQTIGVFLRIEGMTTSAWNEFPIMVLEGIFCFGNFSLKLNFTFFVWDFNV